MTRPPGGSSGDDRRLAPTSAPAADGQARAVAVPSAGGPGRPGRPPGRLGALEARIAHLHPVVAVASVVAGGYLLVCLLFTGLGLVLTHRLGPLTRWDTHVNRWFAENRTTGTNGWTNDATKVANTSGVVVVLVVVVVVLLVLRLRWEALFLVLALALELSSFLAVNTLVDRPRPDVAHLGALPSTSSFPSGHTTAMVALYGGAAVILGRRFRVRAVGVVSWVVVALVTTAIGFARVYRGMHHPSDVAAGALLGLAVLVVAAVAVRSGRMATAARRASRPPGTGRSPESEVGT